VYALIEEWGLTSDDHILDPFVGAGTTLLAAKERGIAATGYDLSPLAVLVTAVKISNYDVERLRDLWSQLRHRLGQTSSNRPLNTYPELVQRALPGKLLGAFDEIQRAIERLEATRDERSFFSLALLSTIRQHSRAAANGGWLRWIERQGSPEQVLADFMDATELMLGDLNGSRLLGAARWSVRRADARALPDAGPAYSAVITSPPYPNRHDYTRVFGVELMFGFLDWEQTRQLRYQSFHSHPEARPLRPETSGYVRPRRLAETVSQIRERGQDRRVTTMIDGYFLDLYLALREMRRVCKRGARIALVVGNAQYRGVPLLVDEFAAEIAEQAGLRVEKLLVVRHRSNSAQQMGKYGRRPSRESVVLLRKA
jgi:DNA modification methylase